MEVATAAERKLTGHPSTPVQADNVSGFYPEPLASPTGEGLPLLSQSLRRGYRLTLQLTLPDNVLRVVPLPRMANCGPLSFHDFLLKFFAASPGHSTRNLPSLYLSASGTHATCNLTGAMLHDRRRNTTPSWDSAGGTNNALSSAASPRDDRLVVFPGEPALSLPSE